MAKRTINWRKDENDYAADMRMELPGNRYKIICLRIEKGFFGVWKLYDGDDVIEVSVSRETLERSADRLYGSLEQLS